MVVPGVTVAFYVKGIFESCGGMYRRYEVIHTIPRPRTQVHSSCCYQQTNVFEMQGLRSSEALPSTRPEILDIQQCYANGRVTYKFIFSEKCSCAKRTKCISVSSTKKITEGSSPAADMWAKATEAVKNHVKAYDGIPRCNLDLSSVQWCLMKSSSIAKTFWDAASIKMKDEVITGMQNSNRTAQANESRKRQKKCNWKDGEDYMLDQIGYRARVEQRLLQLRSSISYQMGPIQRHCR